MAATGARSAAFVPLLADGRVIGVLVVGTTSQPRAFSTEELMLLQTVAGEAAPCWAAAGGTPCGRGGAAGDADAAAGVAGAPAGRAPCAACAPWAA